MWNQYLYNIYAWWFQNYDPTLEVFPPSIIEPTNLTVNPFRRELPSYLQDSQFYYDYNPV
jgi:hypothetical protein